MRLVIAECTVDYEGRLTAHLPRAQRLLMVKADGCVAIHSDGGAYKPLNWMNAPNVLEETDERWVVTNRKGERLEIEIEEVLADVDLARSHEFDQFILAADNAGRDGCRTIVRFLDIGSKSSLMRPYDSRAFQGSVREIFAYQPKANVLKVYILAC